LFSLTKITLQDTTTSERPAWGATGADTEMAGYRYAVLHCICSKNTVTIIYRNTVY